MYVIIWEYVPHPASAADFETAYGPEGVWVQFFRQADSYQGTELLRTAGGRYATIDRWTSAAHYDHFRQLRAIEYEALDNQCALLTTEERWIGSYDVL